MQDNDIETEIQNNINAIKSIAHEIILEPEQNKEKKYRDLFPALSKYLPSAPNRYEPQYMESLAVGLNNPDDLWSLSEEDSKRNQGKQKLSEQLANDPNGEILKPFLNENGIPEFNNNNIRDFFKAVGRSDADIDNLLNIKTGDVQMSFEEINMLTDLQAKVLGIRGEQIKQARELGLIGDGNGLEKGTKKELEARIADGAETLTRLETFMEDEETINDTLSLIGKGLTELAKGADSVFGGKDVAGSKERVGKVTQMESNLKSNLALYIKALSGANVSDKERAFIESFFPNMKMTPTQFKAAMEATIRNVKIAQRVRREMLSKGVNLSEEEMGKAIHGAIKSEYEKSKGGPVNTDNITRDEARQIVIEEYKASGKPLPPPDIMDQLINKTMTGE